jgi:hypothetical protein
VRPWTTPASTSVHGPWQITPTGLAINKVADKADGRLNLAQIIGIDCSARQDEGVVVPSRCLADQPVYGEGDRRVNVLIDGLDLARLDRQQLGYGARGLNCLPGLLEFRLLYAICGKDRDGLALQLACHIALSSCNSIGDG